MGGTNTLTLGICLSVETLKRTATCWWQNPIWGFVPILLYFCDCHPKDGAQGVGNWAKHVSFYNYLLIFVDFLLLELMLNEALLSRWERNGTYATIYVARACAHARHTDDTHAFPKTTLLVASKSRLITSWVRHLLLTLVVPDLTNRTPIADQEPLLRTDQIRIMPIYSKLNPTLAGSPSSPFPGHPRLPC